MKKYYSNEFHGTKDKLDDNKNDINVNLWDLDGSSFFLDKNINNKDNLDSTGTFIDNNTEININNDSNNINLIDIITSKNKKIENINFSNFPFETNYKSNNKLVNTKFIKGNITPNSYDKKNLIKNKILKDTKTKKNKFKNNFFCHNYNGNYNINYSLSKNIDINNQKNSSGFINKNNLNSKARKRVNFSVDHYSKKVPYNMSIIFRYNKLIIQILKIKKCSI